jgi:long-chain acyl-CoA synthetase
MESKVGTEKERENLYLNKPWLKFYPEGLSHEIDIPNISLIQAFDRAVEKWKNKPALIFYGKKISYLELKDQVDRFATALYDLGIRKGDTVALFLLNCPQFAIAYFGALRIGAVVTPISPVYVTPEVKHQLEDSHAQTIICLDILYGFVEKTNVELKKIILTSIDEYLPSLKKVLGKSILKAVYQKMEVPLIKIKERENIYWFQDLIKKSQPNPPKIEINPKEDLAALPYTGGTTGPPKGAMLTHYNVFAMQAINQTFYSYSFEKGRNLEEGKETVIAFLPFYHIYGQVVLLISGIIRGYTLVILTNPNIDDVLSSVGGYDATFFMGVPGLFELLKDYDKTGRVDWKRLKFLVSGADSLLEDTAKTWEKRTGSFMGSFGVPLPNTVVAIVHPETEEMVPLGEIGELVVRGPQVMKGYWNRPEETEKSFLKIAGEKWLRTGDLVRMDSEGYVHFYDRKRDLIKYKGYSIFAREIEEVLKTHPKIKEAAVIGVPDPKVGANIKAVIVLEADARGKMSEEEIVNHCQEKLAHYKVPKIIEFRGEIPRTDVGKVSRRELREEREG